MALVGVNKGFVAPPCHSVNFYNYKALIKVPLYRRFIKHDYKFDKLCKLSSNYKKETKAFPLKISIAAVLNDANYDRISDANDADRSNYDRINYASDAERSSYDRINYANDEISFVNHHLQDPPPSIAFKPPSNVQSFQRFMEGILEMSRLQNYVPSMILVLVGAWIGGGHSVEALVRHGQVWIAAGCSALITVASMLANDIFDFRSGTDLANGKTSPLLRGQVHPYHVELVAGCLYGASVIGICYLEPMSLRLLIGVAAVATYIYTPFFKHLTMVKNVVVSGVISSSILAGALAIGGTEQLRNPVVTAVSLFFFLCVLSRELLMDVGDMVGDKAAGVNTFAVCFGGQISTLTASFCLAAANAILISLLAVKAQAFATIGTLILLPLHAKILALWKDLGATKEALIGKSIQQIVQQSMVHIGFGVLVLASAA